MKIKDEWKELVVDVEYAASVGNILSKAGATLRIAHNAKKALELLKTFKSEIVIIDIRLDGMNGG